MREIYKRGHMHLRATLHRRQMWWGVRRSRIKEICVHTQKCCPSVKQLGSGWDAASHPIPSFFAYGSSVVIGRLWVNGWNKTNQLSFLVIYSPIIWINIVAYIHRFISHRWICIFLEFWANTLASKIFKASLGLFKALKNEMGRINTDNRTL